MAAPPPAPADAAAPGDAKGLRDRSARSVERSEPGEPPTATFPGPPLRPRPAAAAAGPSLRACAAPAAASSLAACAS